MVNPQDLNHLRRCVELARTALDAGDEPFGSVLASADGVVLAEDRNRIAGGDNTRHPEFALARWAANNTHADDRSGMTVYTSGEHCPMCSAAHAWVGLGRIVYIASSAQLSNWLRDWGVPDAPVSPLPIADIAPGVPVDGPVDELLDAVRELHRKAHTGG